MHLKGQNVNLLLKVKNDYKVIAGSTSCDLNITANTDDGASKSDPGEGIFDNPEFTNYSWNMSNESFLVGIEFLGMLLDKVINGDAKFDVQYQIGEGYYEQMTKKGEAFVSSLSVDATNGSYAKLTLSLEGNGTLTNGTYVAPTLALTDKIKGKALMVSINTGSHSSATWKTIACSTSHKLSVNVALSDITDKDYGDSAVYKEVTGKSVSLTTDNLIDLISKTEKNHGASVVDIFGLITGGSTIEMEFGYYPESIGQEKHGHTGTDITGWGKSTEGNVLISGSFLCTSLSQNGANKEDASFSAEFQNKGAVTVAKPAAETSEE